MDLAALIVSNRQRWANAKLTRNFAPVCARLITGKSRYKAVEKATGVPWFVISVVHERESSGRWDASLAQGDPWDEVSAHVPKGRGPFNSWEAAAIDALTKCAPYAARWKDWSAGGALTLLEQYNGLGYAAKGIPSPYVWSGTDQYVKGKYVADGVFDPNVVDKQFGCAGLIIGLKALDPSISFTGEQAPPPPDVPKPEPSVDPWWLQLIKIILSLFTRK